MRAERGHTFTRMAVPALLAAAVLPWAFQLMPKIAAAQSCAIPYVDATYTCYPASDVKIAEARMRVRPVSPMRAVKVLTGLPLTQVAVVDGGSGYHRSSHHHLYATAIAYLFGSQAPSGDGSGGGDGISRYVLLNEVVGRTKFKGIFLTVGHPTDRGTPLPTVYGPWNVYGNVLHRRLSFLLFTDGGETRQTAKALGMAIQSGIPPPSIAHSWDRRGAVWH